MRARRSCVLLTSDHAHLADAAETFARLLFDVRHVSRHARAERSFPAPAAAAIEGGGVDILLNFLAPMIVPSRVLDGVRAESINFHPAPPAWPGIGSPSYALYHQDAAFGATAHRMTSDIDGGEIVGVVRFPIVAGESCDTLSARALNYSLGLFYEISERLSRQDRLAPSGDRWGRRAVTRAEFERWMTLSPADPPDEIRRKVRALRHPRLPGPFFLIEGRRVEIDHASYEQP